MRYDLGCEWMRPKTTSKDEFQRRLNQAVTDFERATDNGVRLTGLTVPGEPQMPEHPTVGNQGERIT